MSDSNLIVPTNTQKMRNCYVAVPTNTDLSIIEELLAERQIQLILSADLPSTGSTFLEGLVNTISNADLFIAVLSPEQSNDQIYMELGIAIAKERRIFILAPPGVSPTLDIAEIPTIRTDAANRDAISFMLDQILEAPPRKYKPQLSWSGPQNGQPIGDLADELLKQLDAPGIREDEIIDLLMVALRKSVPSTIIRSPLFEDNNNLAPVGHSKRIVRPDLMVWSDELGPWIGNPLIVEVKRMFQAKKDCTRAVQQVLDYLQLSQTRSGVIIYANKMPFIDNISSISPPNIFFLEIHELFNAMRIKSFARVMIDLRNRRMHGIHEL